MVEGWASNDPGSSVLSVTTLSLYLQISAEWTSLIHLVNVHNWRRSVRASPFCSIQIPTTSLPVLVAAFPQPCMWAASRNSIPDVSVMLLHRPASLLVWLGRLRYSEHVLVTEYMPWKGRRDPCLGKTLEEAESKAEAIKWYCCNPTFAKVNLGRCLVDHSYMWGPLFGNMNVFESRHLLLLVCLKGV